MLEKQSRLRSILSPLRCFPAEILSEIFEHTVGPGGYSVMNTLDGPWSLSHVSRHWRATAVTGSGVLWSNMYIGIQNCGFRKKDHLSPLRTCLTRSHRRNISVHLDYSVILPKFEDKDEEMVQLLVDNCERCYSLEISDYRLEILIVLHKIRGRIPNLTNVVLRRPEQAIATPIRIFEFPPKLCAVEIHGGFGVVLGPGNPSLISYEDYRRSPPRDSLHEHFTILQSCHNLQTFTKLHAYHDSLGPQVQNPPVILPQLRQFQGSHEDLIQCMTTPNLESFHLDVFRLQSFSNNRNILLNVRDLFIRSGCRCLSKLTLSNCATSHILNILPLVPALAVFQFEFTIWKDRDIDESIFRSLFQQMTNVDEVGMLKVAPKLRELSFMVVPRHNGMSCFDGTLLNMVASRGKTLEKVEVKGYVQSGVWSPEHVSVFETLLKGGMDISLNNFRPWDFSGASVNS
ncbi:hypothetical protein IW261DRAFT_1661183 [Armillaria novae-zelandiae]|uniref:F-box domain-containing protein n=1 Tax=Armillaria novae-zelandiae TaxID=153914 RepID=A0AA39NVY9_9AGAR|nr:hypothetical protein IW261DRAFT_1661183 [Armillaria novae-zelandiae]